MPEKFMKGTGITAKERIRWSMKEPGAADALKAFLGQFKNKTHANGFERSIHRAEAWAKSILGDTSEETAFPDDSQEDFAQRILTEIRFARKRIEEGDAAAAADFAVDVGYLIAQAEIKFGEPRWEDHALRGKASAIGADKGRENRKKAYSEIEEVWREKATELIAKRKRLKYSARDLAKAVAKALDPNISEKAAKKLADSRRNWIEDLV